MTTNIIDYVVIGCPWSLLQDNLNAFGRKGYHLLSVVADEADDNYAHVVMEKEV